MVGGLDRVAVEAQPLIKIDTSVFSLYETVGQPLETSKCHSMTLLKGALVIKQ